MAQRKGIGRVLPGCGAVRTAPAPGLCAGAVQKQLVCVQIEPNSHC